MIQTHFFLISKKEMVSTDSKNNDIYLCEIVWRLPQTLDENVVRNVVGVSVIRVV